MALACEAKANLHPLAFYTINVTSPLTFTFRVYINFFEEKHLPEFWVYSLHFAIRTMANWKHRAPVGLNFTGFTVFDTVCVTTTITARFQAETSSICFPHSLRIRHT